MFSFFGGFVFDYGYRSLEVVYQKVLGKLKLMMIERDPEFPFTEPDKKRIGEKPRDSYKHKTLRLGTNP